MIITIKNIKLTAHLTCHYEYEKSDFQDIFINIKAEIIAKNPKILEETLDYDKLEKDVIAFVMSKQFILIEEIANEIADLALQNKLIKNIHVEVGKINISRADSSSVATYKEQNLVFLALGTNLGDKLVNLKTGIEKISKIIQITDISSVYESEALLLEGSPKEWDMPYFNIVLSGFTMLSPFELLSKIQQAEMQKNTDKWAPRGLDIDIILYNNITLVSEKLTIPHTEYQKRDFVLIPLSEINKDINFNKSHNLKIAYDKNIWYN